MATVTVTSLVKAAHDKHLLPNTKFMEFDDAMQFDIAKY